MLRLFKFFRESDSIESIDNAAGVTKQVAFFEQLIKQEEVTLRSISNYLDLVQPGARVRCNSGDNVRIGTPTQIIYTPPPGGPLILQTLSNYLLDISSNAVAPFEIHKQFETLHPLTDGNGRTGRLLWLWQMWKFYDYRGELLFLEKWYRQSLQASR